MSDNRTKETVMDGADKHYFHSDDELMRRWLRARPKAKRGGTPLWARISEEFCVGSTSAKQICNRHGYDPDQLVTFHG